jgi:hypothetical protein
MKYNTQTGCVINRACMPNSLIWSQPSSRTALTLVSNIILIVETFPTYDTEQMYAYCTL